MTDPKTTHAETLTEDELDGAAGGYELKNVMVTSYQTAGAAAADDRPTEEVAFTYNKIAFSR